MEKPTTNQYLWAETKNIEVAFIGIKIPMFLQRDACVTTVNISVVYFCVPDVYKECESNQIYSSSCELLRSAQLILLVFSLKYYSFIYIFKMRSQI